MVEGDVLLPAFLTLTLVGNSSGPRVKATGFASSLSPIPGA
jgi:hypothetical protein